MLISQDAYQEILSAFSPVPPEAGGILGGFDGIICYFAFDAGTHTPDHASYCPDVERLNSIISHWHASGIGFYGMVHSHPAGQETLSSGDRLYIRRIMECIPGRTASLYFPILIPGKKLVSFVAEKELDHIEIRSDAIIIKKEK